MCEPSQSRSQEHESLESSESNHSVNSESLDELKQCENWAPHCREHCQPRRRGKPILGFGQYSLCGGRHGSDGLVASCSRQEEKEDDILGSRSRKVLHRVEV